jgi:tRNA(fMet)-specific endonuclease VapC
VIYLLDTNACIVYLNRPISGVRRRLESLPPHDIAVCSVVKSELSLFCHSPKTFAISEF